MVTKTQTQNPCRFKFCQQFFLSLFRIHLQANASADLLIFGVIFWWHFICSAFNTLFAMNIMAKTIFHNWFRIANRHLTEYFKLDMSIKRTRIVSFFAVLALPKTIRHRKSNANTFSCTFWKYALFSINFQPNELKFM